MFKSSKSRCRPLIARVLRQHRSSLDENSRHARMPPPERVLQRRTTPRIQGLYIRSSLHQPHHSLRMASTRREMQRSPPIEASRIDKHRSVLHRAQIVLLIHSSQSFHIARCSKVHHPRRQRHLFIEVIRARVPKLLLHGVHHATPALIRSPIRCSGWCLHHSCVCVRIRIPR